MNAEEVPVLILAGGKGTRVAHLLNDLPKPMYPVLNKPFLDYQLEYLKKFGFKKFVLSIDEGLPGRIWRSRKTEWINDVSIQSENYFLRNQIAKAFNVKAGFGFPVFRAQEIIGILVFFTDCACEENHYLVQIAVSAATLLSGDDG